MQRRRDDGARRRGGGGMRKCRKTWEKEGRGQGTREEMDEDFLPGFISKRRSRGTVREFAGFSFTSSLLTLHSCLIIFFVLVNMHAIYFCKTSNPNLFIV